MNCLFFYFPFTYLFRSRLYTFYKFVSWLIIYGIPVYLLYGWVNSFSMQSSFFYLLSVLLIYNFYEIGYIQNDTETIKREKKPTLRLKNFEYEYYEKYKKQIYIFRLCVGLFLMLVFYDYLYIGFLVALVSVLLFYLIYNNIRNRWNLLVNMGLVLTRYCAPLCVLGNISVETLIVATLIYPFLNFIERASTERFHIYFLLRMMNGIGLTWFRVIYYFCFTCIFGVLSLFYSNYLHYFLLFIGLLFFRYLILKGVKKGMAPSNYLNA